LARSKKRGTAEEEKRAAKLLKGKSKETGFATAARKTVRTLPKRRRRTALRKKKGKDRDAGRTSQTREQLEKKEKRKRTKKRIPQGA